jgi:hypothetical protein
MGTVAARVESNGTVPKATRFALNPHQARTVVDR